jgi:hypothetical protein
MEMFSVVWCRLHEPGQVHTLIAGRNTRVHWSGKDTNVHK